jgi:hypothetical protein
MFMSLCNRRRRLSFRRRPLLVVMNCSGTWQKQTEEIITEAVL